MPESSVVDSLRSMLGLANLDPVSMTSEQRLSAGDGEAFLGADEEASMAAFAEIEEERLTALQLDMFEFLENVRRFSQTYEEDGSLWERFGDERGAQMVNIEIDHLRTVGKLRISRFTVRQLIALTSTNMRDWALPWIPKLEGLPPGSMATYYTDDVKSKEHGFPFDIALVSSRD